MQHSKQHTLHLSYISSQFNSFPPHHPPSSSSITRRPGRAFNGNNDERRHARNQAAAVCFSRCYRWSAAHALQHLQHFRAISSPSSPSPHIFPPFLLTRRCDRWGRRAILCLRPALHVPYSLHSVIFLHLTLVEMLRVHRFIQAERGVTPGWGGAGALVEVRDIEGQRTLTLLAGE